MASEAPQEVENTLQRLSQHRGVRGVMVLSNESGKVIKHTGSLFDGLPGPNAENRNGSIEPGLVAAAGEEDAANTSHARAPSATPMINETVRKYADAVRKLVASSADAVGAIDEKVRVSYDTI